MQPVGHADGGAGQHGPAGTDVTEPSPSTTTPSCRCRSSAWPSRCARRRWPCGSPGRALHGHLLSIVMVWVAWNTLLLTKFLGLSGKLPPVLPRPGRPTLLFMALGVYFLWRME